MNHIRRLLAVIPVLAAGIACPISTQSQASAPDVRAFFRDMAEGNTNAALRMLESKTNLAHLPYGVDKLPLLEAAATGNLTLVKRLVELGVDINATGDSMMSAGLRATALHFAVMRNQFDVCQWLLQAGANPNMMSARSETPLHVAFFDNREEIAGLLLDYGADPFQGKRFLNDHTTPFQLAIRHTSGRFVPRMLGQDPQNPLGAKAPRKTLAAKPPHTARKVEKGKATPEKILREEGQRLLGTAAQRGQLEAVQALIKAGVPVRGANDREEPILRGFALSYSRMASKPGFDEQRWMKIRDFLITNGADYDVLAATALGDLERARQLAAADARTSQATDTAGQTPLHWAVLCDRPRLTEFWVKSGTSASATNTAGQTALHLAAGKGLAEHVTILLSAGTQANSKDTNGWTPLEVAMQANQSATIRLLLTNSTTAVRPDRGIASNLHEAAARGNTDALAVLLREKPANLEAPNELGLTPLHVAVENGHLAAAALLVDSGAKVNARDPAGNTALHRIFLYHPRLIVRNRPPTDWLSRTASGPHKDTYIKYLTVGRYEQGPNPLLQAASLLLACGIDARATNLFGNTVMQLLTDEKVSQSLFLFDDDQTALLRLLGSGSADVDEPDANGDTALHRTGQEVLVDGTASLIASGASINATNLQGQTPLHKFAAKIHGWDLGDGSNQPFQLLLKSGSNVNAQDREGLTPLHVIASADTSFKAEATKALLAAGANPGLRDKQGRTPIHIFLSGKWPWMEVLKCVTLLVEAGADLSARDNHGRTPLHYLAALGNKGPLFVLRGITDLFIAAKVDLQVKDEAGDTPLHVAARSGTTDVFQWLVKQGASQVVTNKAGETPQQLATKGIR